MGLPDPSPPSYPDAGPYLVDCPCTQREVDLRYTADGEPTQGEMK